MMKCQCLTGIWTRIGIDDFKKFENHLSDKTSWSALDQSDRPTDWLCHPESCSANMAEEVGVGCWPACWRQIRAKSRLNNFHEGWNVLSYAPTDTYWHALLYVMYWPYWHRGHVTLSGYFTLTEHHSRHSSIKYISNSSCRGSVLHLCKHDGLNFVRSCSTLRNSEDVIENSKVLHFQRAQYYSIKIIVNPFTLPFCSVSTKYGVLNMWKTWQTLDCFCSCILSRSATETAVQNGGVAM